MEATETRKYPEVDRMTRVRVGCDGCLGYATWHDRDGDQLVCEGCGNRRGPLDDYERAAQLRPR